jgi:glutathione S-transferase
MDDMILIGQYDSPFVRRVAIALKLYGLAFEHRPWSTFGEGDKIAPFNPLRRVPTLVLDDGEALIESSAILDHLDELVGPEKAMTAARGPQRRHALKTIALATGLGDKSVSLVYERVLRKDDKRSKIWVERCEAHAKETVKTIVRGMPVESVFACGDYARVLSLFARETAGATAHPAFPAPSDFFEGRVFLHHSGAKLRRENALVCRGQTLSTHHLAPLKGNGSSVRAVIARSESDEAIQNSPTFDFWIASLRSQ